jgi:integrase
MVELQQQNGIAPMALRFLILTACRTGELRFATWSEFNLEKKQWDIPAARMKADIEHRVALPDAAVEMLENLPQISDYVFPGWKRGQPLSSSAFRVVLRKMGIGKEVATPHGFRSSFRDYIGEETGFPHRLAEFALAHQLTDEAEKAYARGDMLKKRFAMMNTWAKYVDSKSTDGKVLLFSKGV